VVRDADRVSSPAPAVAAAAAVALLVVCLQGKHDSSTLRLECLRMAALDVAVEFAVAVLQESATVVAAHRLAEEPPAPGASHAVVLVAAALECVQVAALGVVVQFSRAAPRSSAIVTDVQILAKEAAALDASHVVVPAVVAARDRQKIAVQIHSPPNFNTTP